MKQITASYKSILALSIISALSADNTVITDPDLGTTEWSNSNPDVAELRHGADGQLFLVGGDHAGTTIVSVSGDSDPATPETYVGSIQVTFLPAEVCLVNMDATPVTQAELDAAMAPAVDLATPAASVVTATPKAVAAAQDATPEGEA